MLDPNATRRHPVPARARRRRARFTVDLPVRSQHVLRDGTRALPASSSAATFSGATKTCTRPRPSAANDQSVSNRSASVAMPRSTRSRDEAASDLPDANARSAPASSRPGRRRSSDPRSRGEAGFLPSGTRRRTRQRLRHRLLATREPSAPPPRLAPERRRPRSRPRGRGEGRTAVPVSGGFGYGMAESMVHPTRPSESHRLKAVAATAVTRRANERRESRAWV